MKNIFKTNLIIPKNVKLFIKSNLLFISGPYGLICLNIAFLKNKKLTTKNKKKFFLSFFRLFQKKLLGVCLKFVVSLTFVGVNSRLEGIENGFIKLKLGFSHFVFIQIPSYIKIFTSPKKNILVISCIDEMLLKAFCSKIRLLKLPDVYKGKGILYKNQVILLKEGKKK